MRRSPASAPTRFQLISYAAVSSLALAACADPLTGPPARPSHLLPTAAVSANRPTFPLVSNRQRYRVIGSAHATGRSGNAEVTARAMAGKDGKTVVELSTGGLDAAFAPRGAFTKAQVKILDPGNSGSVLSTTNYAGLTTGYFSATYGGLGAGFPLQFQANVKGADGNRTDVVTVSERVKRRPDLAVTLGTLGNALVRAPADIAATVRELNGDLGAVGDCVLVVDGVVVDRASGIWVDAGDAVSCAFLYAFATAGSHAVKVRVEGVAPGDWDTANNEATGTITIVDPKVEPRYWQIYATQLEFSQSGQVNGYTRSVLPPSAPGYWERTFGFSDSRRNEERHMSLNGYGAPFISFPLQSFQASFWSDGRLIQSASLAGPIDFDESYIYADPVFSSKQFCMFRMSDATAIDGGPAGRMYVQVCSSETTSDGGASWTQESSVYARQYAGTVTYWSAGFSETRFRAADGTMACYPNECYTFNDVQNYTTGAPPFLTLGDEVRGTFDVVGANGVHLTLDKSASMTPFSFEIDQPYGCYDDTDPTVDFVHHFCETYTFYRRGKSGFSSSP